MQSKNFSMQPRSSVARQPPARRCGIVQRTGRYRDLAIIALALLRLPAISGGNIQSTRHSVGASAASVQLPCVNCYPVPSVTNGLTNTASNLDLVKLMQVLR
jgi:hypothetical protein